MKGERGNPGIPGRPGTKGEPGLVGDKGIPGVLVFLPVLPFDSELKLNDCFQTL